MDQFESRLRAWHKAEAVATQAEENARGYLGTDPQSTLFLRIQAERHRQDADGLLQKILVDMQRRRRAAGWDTRQ